MEENKNQLQLYQPQPQALTIFDDAKTFEHVQRVVKALAMSEMVPKAYQGKIENCLVAYELARSVNKPLMTVIQNMDVIQGRPSWKASYIIASVNSSGRFATPLRFEISKGEMVEVEFVVTEWVNREKVKKPGKIKVRNNACYAWVKDHEGNVIKGPTITIEMAVKEGWYTKPDSKWLTMEELMLQYRAAAFFGRLHCPDITNGMYTVEETREMVEVESTVIDSKPLNKSAANQAAEVLNAKIKSKKEERKEENGASNAAESDADSAVHF